MPVIPSPQKPFHQERPRHHHQGRFFFWIRPDHQVKRENSTKIMQAVKRKAGVWLPDAFCYPTRFDAAQRDLRGNKLIAELRRLFLHVLYLLEFRVQRTLTKMELAGKSFL